MCFSSLRHRITTDTELKNRFPSPLGLLGSESLAGEPGKLPVASLLGPCHALGEQAAAYSEKFLRSTSPGTVAHDEFLVHDSGLTEAPNRG